MKVGLVLCSLIVTLFSYLGHALCDDVLDKIKKSIKENSKEIFKELNKEIEQLKHSEEFNVLKVLETSFLNNLRNHTLYDKEKEVFKKIEEEYEVLKQNPTLQKIQAFMKNCVEYIKKHIPDSETIIKDIEIVMSVVEGLRNIPLPKGLNLPTTSSPTQVPNQYSTQSEIAQYQYNANIPRPAWQTYDSCNGNNCNGCCIRQQCFPHDECTMIFASRTIIFIAVMCIVCCCCCGIAIGFMFYFNKKRVQLEDEETQRKLKKSGNFQPENTSETELPVRGIPVQQSTDSSVVIVAQVPQDTSSKQQGFTNFVEESLDSSN